MATAHVARNLLELPPELIYHIVSFLDVNTINKLRLVCRPLKELCKDALVTEIEKLRGKTQSLLDNARVAQPPPLHLADLTQGYTIVLQVISSLTFLMNEPNRCESDCCCFNVAKVVESGKKFLELVRTERVMEDDNLIATGRPLLRILQMSMKHEPNASVYQEISTNAATLYKWIVDNAIIRRRATLPERTGAFEESFARFIDGIEQQL